LRSRDAVEIAVDQAVAVRVRKLRTDDEVARDTNQANQIGSRVGQIVGRALSQAIENIAQAMRG
jgi:hypothetical protein